MPWKNSGLRRLWLTWRCHKSALSAFSYLCTWTCVININQGIFFTQSDVHSIGSLWLPCTLTEPPAKVCWSVHLDKLHLPLVFACHLFTGLMQIELSAAVVKVHGVYLWKLVTYSGLTALPHFYHSRCVKHFCMYRTSLNVDTFFSLSHHYKVNAHSTMRLFFSRL